MADKPAKKREIVRKKSNSFVEIYSNDAELRTSFLDFQILFGKILDATPERLEVEQQIGIIMTPQQTKQLWQVLTENLEKYAKQYGSIPNPPKYPTSKT